MTFFLILKYVHILLFVFWLGTDMGTYYASKFVINPNLSAPQRSTALQILLGCDLGPRIAMPLIMPTGLHMGALLGLVSVTTSTLIAIWVLGILWLILVLAVHFGKDENRKKKLKNIDLWIRPFIVLSVSAIAIYSLFDNRYLAVPYLSYKLLIVCALILFGVGIRYQLSRFTPAFINLMQGKEIDESNAIMKKRMDACLPYVYGIWAGLLINGALGLHLI